MSQPNCPTLRTAVDDAQPERLTGKQRLLGKSLACYTSPDDWGMPRRDFLEMVIGRISMDLDTGEY